MRLLDRYVLVTFLIAFAVCLGTVVGTFVVVDGSANLKKFLTLPRGNVLEFVLGFYAARIPLLLTMLFPAITLAAGAFAVIRLARANEWTPILLAGVPAHRALRPIYVAGLGIGALMAADQEFLVPHLARTLIQHENRLEKNERQTNLLLSDPRNYSLFMRSYRIREHVMEEVAITRVDRDGNLLSDTLAAEARWDADTNAWILYDGQTQRFTRNGKHDGPLERFGAEGCPWAIDLTPEDVSKYLVPLAYYDLEALLDLAHRYPYQPAVRVQIHGRIAGPISNLVLLGLGIPLCLRRDVRQILVGLGICLIVCAAFYVVQIIFLKFGAAGIVHPILAVWGPVLFFGCLAAAFQELVPT